MRELATRAIAEYQAVLASNPRLVIAWADLVEMAGLMRDGALMQESYAKALEIAPASWLVRVGLLSACGVPNERYGAFLDDPRRYEKQNPLLLQITADGERKRANHLWHVERRYDEALGLYDQQIRTLDVYDVHEMRGRLLRVMKRYPEALGALDHAIALMPGKTDGYDARGWVHLQAKRFPEAAADFRRALEIDPLDPDVNSSLGQALEDGGDWQGAIAAYERSAKLSLDAWVLYKIARLQMDAAKNPKAAVAAAERALALDATDKWLWFTYAKALDGLGDPRKVKAFARFLELADPSSAKDRSYIEWAKQRSKAPVGPLPRPPASQQR